MSEITALQSNIVVGKSTGTLSGSFVVVCYKRINFAFIMRYLLRYPVLDRCVAQIKCLSDIFKVYLPTTSPLLEVETIQAIKEIMGF